MRTGGFSAVRSGTWSVSLKSGGPIVRSLDGGWSCLELVAVRAIKELCGLVWSRTTMVHVVV